MAVEESVRSILSSEFGLDSSSLETDAAIFSAGLLDSLNSLRLLMMLESQFGLSISPLDVSLDDVDSISKITETVNRLKD
ncbi:MAG: phosphopantetheine-binding protein [Ruegeria sp.]|uniref:phosphopantetheine-binding protein n=1 Tax=Ruegeria sp. ANG-S4 TaxID=1577904 RepID=UPI00187CD9E5|nr:phosphopantetheine-binding protein [Ruegeria sp. ANG-S4]